MAWRNDEGQHLKDLASLGIAASGRYLAQHGLIVLLARLDELPEGLVHPLPHEQRAAARLAPTPGRGHLARRQIVRSILARAYGIAPDDVSIKTDALGAPYLNLPEGVAAHAVSFSARRNLAMIGLMRCGPHRVSLGVDIENALGEDLIPWNMLHADERAALTSFGPNSRANRMLRLWTLKEATVKALGQGFRIPPEEVGVLFSTPVQNNPSGEGTRIFLRNRAANAALERATVLTWRVQAGLKDIRPNEDVDDHSPAGAAAVIIGADTQMTT